MSVTQTRSRKNNKIVKRISQAMANEIKQRPYSKLQLLTDLRLVLRMEPVWDREKVKKDFCEVYTVTVEDKIDQLTGVHDLTPEEVAQMEKDFREQMKKKALDQAAVMGYGEKKPLQLNRGALRKLIGLSALALFLLCSPGAQADTVLVKVDRHGKFHYVTDAPLTGSSIQVKKTRWERVKELAGKAAVLEPLLSVGLTCLQAAANIRILGGHL